MKTIIAMISAGILALFLSGCGEDNTKPTANETGTNAPVQPAPVHNEKPVEHKPVDTNNH